MSEPSDAPRPDHAPTKTEIAVEYFRDTVKFALHHYKDLQPPEDRHTVADIRTLPDSVSGLLVELRDGRVFGVLCTPVKI